MWHRIFIAIIIITAPLLGILIPSSTPVMAATAVNIVVRATPGENPGPSPIDFMTTYISSTQVDLSWIKPGDALGVLVRAKYGYYPVDRTDGYLVYYGALESASDTTMDFEEVAGKLYYRAWAEYAGDDWSKPTESYIEGPWMTNIITMALIAAIVALTFWQKSLFLYAITTPLAIVYGLSLATSNDVNTPLWVAGIIIAIIGMYCLFRAVMMGFDLIKSRGRE